VHLGVVYGVFRGSSGGIRDCQGALRVYFVSETAQVELKSGRGLAPAIDADLSASDEIMCCCVAARHEGQPEIAHHVIQCINPNPNP